MTLHPPQWSSSETIPALGDRQLIGSLWRTAGVVDLIADHLKVSQRAAGGANMSVDVAPGACVVAGTDVALQGRVHCSSDAIVNKVVNAAPGAGTSRIDRIYARWLDADALGGASSWDVGYVAGTAAASPTAPALPASSIPLAQFTVLSSTTSIVDAMITDQRTEATFAQRGMVVADFQAAVQTIGNGANADKSLTFVGSHPTGLSSSLFYSSGTPTRMLIPWTGIYDFFFHCQASDVGGFGWDLFLHRAASSTHLSSNIGNLGLQAPLVALGMFLTAGEYLRINIANATGASRTYQESANGHPRLVFRGASS